MILNDKAKYWVIIPAAGIGSRMQSDRPKQYLNINTKPMLAHVVDTFTSLLKVEKVVVVINPKDFWWSTLSLQHPEKVLTAIGGKRRVDSVLLGLQFLQDYSDKNDWILVHDAARPGINESMLENFIKSIDNHSVGGLLGLPVVDTLKCVDQDGLVERTVSREGLWRAQTPQMFRYNILKSSIENALSNRVDLTDESSAVEFAGYKPKMVLGEISNFKVTYPKDLELFEFLRP